MAEKDGDMKAPDDPTAADAEWKKIQQNTFTRWCNEHLKCVNLYIYNIETDLCDGLKLIALLQVLSHKKIARYNKKPTFRPQKLENIAIALKFIETEDIKLVNIDASDIFKGNLKLILGLIWTLILKYQISLPMIDDDDEGSENMTPKQALMGWVKSKLPPEVEMGNFNKDWNSGKAIGALVDAVAPGLLSDWEDMTPDNPVENARKAMKAAEDWLGIPQLPVTNFNKDWNDGIKIASLVEATAPGLFPEWEDLSPDNALENATEAMKLAEEWLGVPQVITPEEITNPKVDELSVMTYVSYFPEAKVKPGAPLKPKMNDASKCSASGPGLQEHGVVVNKPADFTVFSSGSSRGKISVQVFGPGRKAIDCMVQDNHDNTYSCQYVAPKTGVYDVHIKVGGHHIPKSPFRVNVASDLDTSKVIAQGPGLEPHGVCVGRPAVFEVIATEAGSGDLVIDVIDPKGNKKTELKIEEKPNNVYNCMYMPVQTGRYVIVIKYGGKEVAKSPYHVNVTPAADKVKIYGPGLEAGLKTGKPTTFTIDCSEAGEGGLDVNIGGPGKGDVDLDLKDNGDGTFTCTYKPTKAGQYVITVKFDNSMVPKCPVKVSVGSTADPSKITAWGPGLERGVAGRPAEFYVNCKNAPIDNLTIGVEGAGEAKVEMKDQGNGTVTVVYFPSKPGRYTIHIMYDEIDIKDSPYTVDVSPHGDISKVYADGPGLKDGNMAGKPTEFTVYTKGAGVTGSVQVKCVDESGKEVPCHVKDNHDGTFTVTYQPKTPGKYVITISFMDEEIPKSPVNVTIIPFSDPTKVKATGPGLQGGKTAKPAKFKIDASKAGEGGIGLTIEGPTEAEIKCDDNGDGTCDVEYMPTESGEYKINVLFAEEHIPGSPFTATISDEFDASKVKIEGDGLKPGNKAGKPCKFTVDTRKAGKAKLGVEVEDEVQSPVNVDVVETSPGLFDVTYQPEKEGTHTVNVTFGGKHVPKSPAKVKISPSSDASKVKVSGPGIHPSNVKSLEPTYFEIDASEAGEGNVDINIEPTGKNMPQVKDIDVKEGKKPNSYIVTYIPPKEGTYTITVTFAGVAVPKSPFKISVKPGCDASKCNVHGPGIEEPIVGQESAFTVDTPPEAGKAPLTCTIDSPSGKKTPASVKDNGKEGFDVKWTPKEVGRHKITIKYGDQEVPGSPFYVNVLPKPDPTKVKAFGPGLENAYVKKPAEFTVDTKNAGPGNLGLTIEGPEEAKIDCKDNGDGTCSVSYVPPTEGDYTVNILFDDTHIPGSPFNVGATHPIDASKVKVKGKGVDKKIPASKPVEFTVDATKAGKAPLEVDIDGPGDKKYPCDVKDNGDGTFVCSYVPDKKGKYSVTPKYGGTPVPGAPFKVSGEPTGNPSKVKCSGPGLSRPHVGHAAPFEVDTSKAGDGNLNVNAKGPNGEELPVKMVEEDGVYACEYTPEELGPHELEVLFGGQPVTGSPFKADATPVPELDKVKTPILEEILEAGPCVEQQFEAPVDCSDVPDNKGAKLTGKITTPSGKKEKVDVKDNFDGTFALNYTPKEVGKYILDVGYDGIPIPGSPFEFEVTEGGPDKVKVYGKGIKKGIVAVPSRFTVDTKNAGPGDLAVQVEGPSKVDIECVDNGDGTCEVTYVPVEPGEYDVIVKFDGQQVPGSPFKPKVVQDEPAVEVGRPSDLCMSPDAVSSKDVPSLKGVLEAPSGKEKPVDVSEGPNDSIIASFVPEEPGKNLLHVKKRNKPIEGSPIPILVREKPVIGEESSVPLECADCDLPKDVPQLKAILTRPNGKDEPCGVEPGPDDTVAISFVPEEPGKHIIKVFKNNRQIEDSPFVVMVEGNPDQYPKVGQPLDKEYYQPEPCRRSDVSKMKGTLRRPTGKEEPVDVKLGTDGTIAVSFVPTEPGEHLVSVKKDGRHVPNSPFSIIVIEEPTVPTVGSECAANFDIPELDLPKDLKDLKGTLKRPTGKEEPLELSVGPDNSLAINFVPKEPGRHEIGIKKRGKHVKDSPFAIDVEEGKPTEETPGGPVVGRGCGVNLDIPELDLPRDLKNVTAELTRPTGKKEPIECDLGPDDTLAVNFTPTEPGKHLIDVKKRGRPVKGSPFEIMVGKAPVDEGAIPVTEEITAESAPEDQSMPDSDFLDSVAPEEKPVTVGSPCDVNLDIEDIKLPEDLDKLTAELKRPSGKKEPVKCEMAPDGSLALGFVPEETGKHLLDVKKDKKPVKGSPFEIMVEESTPSDTKPTVGNKCDLDLDVPELDLPKDLKDLKAKLTRPNGQKEDIPCTCTPDNTLGLEFTPKEPGKHLVDVTKKGKPVKGSPFEIMVEPSEEDSKPTVGNKCDLGLDIPDVNLPRDLKDLTAELERPSGKKEPIECTCTPDNTLGLEFTPEEPGKHKVDVKKRGRPVKGSPFEIMVSEPESDQQKPTVGNKCDLDLDIPELDLPKDLKDLKAKLTRPNGQKEDIPCTCTPDNTLGLEFTPKEPGKHLVDVTKKGKPVKGSPFEIMVEPSEEDAKPTVGNKCDLGLDIPDVNLPRDLKDLTAELERPNGKKEPIECTCTPDNTLGLEFTPEEPGKHKVDVKKRGRPVKGSPFEVMVDAPESAPQKPTVGNNCDVDLDIPDLNLPADLKYLTAELTRPTGKKEPIDCKSTPENTLSLEFTPSEAGKHLIDVKKNRKPVKGSPFEVMVEEPEPEQTKPTVGNKCDLGLDIPELNLPRDIDDVKAKLTRPSGKKEDIPCRCNPDNTLGLEFTPKEPGKHYIDVTKKGKPVSGSPFEVMVESQPTVGHKCDVDFDIPDVDLPKDLKDLEAMLTRPTGKKDKVPCTCTPDNTLGLEFTPTEPGRHLIDVKKKGKPVKGSPFEVMVDEETPISKVPTVGSECDVNLEIPGLDLPRDFKNLKGTLKRPNKKTEEPLELTLNENKTIGVTFIPESPGRHEISIKKHGKHVSGSPFDVMVEEAPDSISEPHVGSPVDISLDMSVPEEELKYLKGTLERPNGKEEPIDVTLDDKGHPCVSFTPTEEGLHKINIKRHGKHVPGSPIEVMVGPAKRKPTCDVGFEIPGIKLPDDLKYLKGSVVSPSGTEEPVELMAGPNNTIVVSFLPKEAGTHYIHIKRNGKHVGDSPYEVHVKPEDVSGGAPDASKVKCYGPGLKRGRPNKTAKFTVDTHEAGYGGLGLSVEGPSKVEINCVDNGDGTCSVDYVPAEPGVYLINVTYADVHVPGSPFKCNISDGPELVDEDFTAITDGDLESTPETSDMLAFPSSKARSPQDFVIKFSGSGDLNASVTRPSGVEDDAEVVETGPDTYTVRFVPRETGEHLVNVKSRRRHIPGSPFKVLVEAPAGGAGACTAHGPGLEGGVAGQPCRFTVVTRDAGPGGLAVAVEGPAKAEIQCHDNGDGSCDITWYPVESGEYMIHIRFADEAIPGSPFKAFVLPADQGKAIPMESFKDQVLRVGQQASFAVQMKGKKGKITASVKSPSGEELDCSAVELEEGNYAVRFVPRELGDHLVSVFLEGHHIPGSPFTVKVGGLEGDPSKVSAYGPGLKGGVAKRPAEFTVNALNAGSGALALSIDGPAKVKMNCVEQDDGTYKVIYNPTVAGIYEISIRFAGQHIPGSAYKVRIVESEDEMDALNLLGDASKCDAKGSGLRHAKVGEPASFTVDASNAGRASIMVGVEGPIIPAKEIIVRHTGNNVYSVNYILEKPGDYVLKVLWGDNHIPGSPFHVVV